MLRAIASQEKVKSRSSRRGLSLSSAQDGESCPPHSGGENAERTSLEGASALEDGQGGPQKNPDV